MTRVPDKEIFNPDPTPPFLSLPMANIVPILARDGQPSVNLDLLSEIIQDVAVIHPMLSVQSAEHWADMIAGLDETVDALFLLSNPAYPTEIWNANPHPLVERGIPVVFWCLIEHDEPDFWRYAARDLLRTLGAEVYIVNNNQEGIWLLKGLALRRFLRESRLLVFGEQNFPWNAHALGRFVMQKLGLQILVKPLAEFRNHYSEIMDTHITQYWQDHQKNRYWEEGVQPQALKQALHTALAIRMTLLQEKALGFGVNCFGDLIVRGDRDVPCLAQLLLREEGFVAACDGDFIPLIGMLFSKYLLEQPSMTSNLYPVRYSGALTSHFGNPLSPDDAHPRENWHNYARLAHCGYVGVVSPEMTSNKRVRLSDWGGTYEIKRDGRGCGVDGDLVPGQEITVFSCGFDMNRLMIAKAAVAETTRHAGMPHCESSALLCFKNLPDFFENVSRDHVVVVYGDHARELHILAQVLGLEVQLFE